MEKRKLKRMYEGVYVCVRERLCAHTSTCVRTVRTSGKRPLTMALARVLENVWAYVCVCQSLRLWMSVDKCGCGSESVNGDVCVHLHRVSLSKGELALSCGDPEFHENYI